MPAAPQKMMSVFELAELKASSKLSLQEAFGRRSHRGGGRIQQMSGKFGGELREMRTGSRLRRRWDCTVSWA